MVPSVLFSTDLKLSGGILFSYSRYYHVDAICHVPKLNSLVFYKANPFYQSFWKSNKINTTGFTLLIILKVMTPKVQCDNITLFHQSKCWRRKVTTFINSSNKFWHSQSTYVNSIYCFSKFLIYFGIGKLLKFKLYLVFSLFQFYLLSFL